MAQHAKEYEILHCKIEVNISKKLRKTADDLGVPKTKIVERALEEYFLNHDKEIKAVRSLLGK